MENFNFSDFAMEFEFDFQQDFTPNENRVIDDILTNPIEFDMNSSSFSEYFGRNSATANDVAATAMEPSQPMEPQLQHQQMTPFGNGACQNGFHQPNFPTTSYQLDASVAEQNVDGIDFDWTTFLDDKATVQPDTVVNEPSTEAIDQQNRPEQDGLQDSSNVINENGFVYQELNTLDIPQIYGNLDRTFGLNDLRKLDECLDYESLSVAKHSNQQNNNDDDDDDEYDGGDSADDTLIGHVNGPLQQKKVFLMPLQLDLASTESLNNVAAKLKKHPLIVNSMLNQCGRTKKSDKIVLSSRPKHVKQQSERYLSVRERLERIASMDFAVPMIPPSNERRQRKQPLKIDGEKVPIQYAVSIVLTEQAEEKSSSTKKQTQRTKPTPNDVSNEPKKSRRLNQTN